jgi:hypothetical protein
MHAPKTAAHIPICNKHNIMGRLMSVVVNYAICPIVFNVYEGLKKELRPAGISRYRYKIGDSKR